MTVLPGSHFDVGLDVAQAYRRFLVHAPDHVLGRRLGACRIDDGAGIAAAACRYFHIIAGDDPADEGRLGLRHPQVRVPASATTQSSRTSPVRVCQRS